MMHESTKDAIKGWFHVNYMYVFESVLHFGMNHERVIDSDIWTMLALVDREGFTPEKTRQIMNKVKAVAIRKAVKRLDEIGQGAYDEDLKCWRGF